MDSFCLWWNSGAEALGKSNAKTAGLLLPGDREENHVPGLHLEYIQQVRIFLEQRVRVEAEIECDIGEVLFVWNAVDPDRVALHR